MVTGAAPPEGGVSAVKVITAVLRTDKVDDVTRDLINAGARGMTVTEVLGFGQQHGHAPGPFAVESGALLLPKARIDVVVQDRDAAAVTEAIAKSARTGAIGDGKIWVCPVEGAVRVRTGERDDDAI
jgi:nitrogen regulatory protein P-II 1